MFVLIIFITAAFFIFSMNASALRILIDDGYFDHPFWTRSLRSVFLAPPFALMILMTILVKKTFYELVKDLKFITTKRVK